MENILRWVDPEKLRGTASQDGTGRADVDRRAGAGAFPLDQVYEPLILNDIFKNGITGPLFTGCRHPSSKYP